MQEQGRFRLALPVTRVEGRPLSKEPVYICMQEQLTDAPDTRYSPSHVHDTHVKLLLERVATSLMWKDLGDLMASPDSGRPSPSLAGTPGRSPLLDIARRGIKSTTQLVSDMDTDGLYCRQVGILSAERLGLCAHQRPTHALIYLNLKAS
jgi:hypothetical protein